MGKMAAKSKPGKREFMTHLNEAATLGLSRFVRSANLFAMRHSSDSCRKPMGIVLALDEHRMEGPSKAGTEGEAGAGGISVRHLKMVGTCWWGGIHRVTHAESRGLEWLVELKVREPVSCNALVVPRCWPLKRPPSMNRWLWVGKKRWRERYRGWFFVCGGMEDDIWDFFYFFHQFRQSDIGRGISLFILDLVSMIFKHLSRAAYTNTISQLTDAVLPWKATTNLVECNPTPNPYDHLLAAQLCIKNLWLHTPNTGHRPHTIKNEYWFYINYSRMPWNEMANIIKFWEIRILYTIPSCIDWCWITMLDKS